jgi:colanic acid biosynthesis glycosyl transferase WcaI
MHVVLLNQPFYPDVVATAQMGKDLADALIARGHSVSAVASRSIYGKAGATLSKFEVADKIEIHRVGFSIFGRRGILARAFDFAFFYVLAACKLLTMKKPDVVVAFTTPPFIALLGLVTRLARGPKAVYWVMDLYPDVAVESGLFRAGSIADKIFGFFGRVLLRRSDATVVLGRCMRDRVLKNGAIAEKVHFIPVWSDESGVKPIAASESPFRGQWGLKDSFVVMYSGNFGIGHECQTILDAMLTLSGEQERAKKKVDFLFVGAGKRKPEVLAFKEKHTLANVQWREYVPREQLGQSLATGDVHLISLKTGMEGLIVPSKLFGIMAAARPAIFVGEPGSEIARILTENQCGFVVKPGDTKALVEAVRTLAADPTLAARMGANARAALLGRFDKSTACGQWAELLERVVGVPAPAAAEVATPAGPAAKSG